LADPPTEDKVVAARRQARADVGLTSDGYSNSYPASGPNSTTQLQLAAADVLTAFRELGIDPRTRPEDLSVELWRRLAHALKD